MLPVIQILVFHRLDKKYLVTSQQAQGDSQVKMNPSSRGTEVFLVLFLEVSC